MDDPVRYDNSLGTKASGKTQEQKEAEWQERYARDLAERNRHADTVERFRNGPKHHEGFLERSEGFAEINFPGGPPIIGRHRRERYRSLKMIDFIFEYIDSFLGAVIVAVVVWMLIPKLIPVAIAAVVGFALGTALKLRVHDRKPAHQAFHEGLPICLVFTLIAALFVLMFLIG